MPALMPTVRRSLADRLQRLSSNFDSLGHQLRDEIATAVGKAIAEAVSDAIRSVLGNGQENHLSPSRRGWPQEQPRPLWDQPHQRDQDPWAAPADDPWLLENRYESECDEDVDPEPPSSTPSSTPRLRSWVAALTTGWQAGLWWLKRQQGKAPVLTTLAVGLAAGLVILAAGPVAAAAVSAVGAVVGLTTLSDAAQSTTNNLAGALSP
jgi:hypothetical protein